MDILCRKGGQTIIRKLLNQKADGIFGRDYLVEECIRFARSAGYKEMTLWTNHVLKAARAIYRKKGFKIIKKERHRSFGHDLVGETWRMVL